MKLEPEKHYKIVKKDYSYECGEKCCYTSGSEWYVNEVFVHRSTCEDSGWLEVLKHLGIKVDLTWQDENGVDTSYLDNYDYNPEEK